jgi:hypothetical protein
MEILVISFNVESVEDDKRTEIEKNVKFVEEFRKLPKTMMKYPQKKNTDKYLFYC